VAAPPAGAGALDVGVLPDGYHTETLAGAAVSLADSVDSPAVPEMGGEPMIGP